MAAPRPKAQTSNKYHLVLADGTERTLVATEARVDGGSLVLRNKGGDSVIYAQGLWKLCELEREDDEG
jgi:hypothetical protein